MGPARAQPATAKPAEPSASAMIARAKPTTATAHAAATRPTGVLPCENPDERTGWSEANTSVDANAGEDARGPNGSGWEPKVGALPHAGPLGVVDGVSIPSRELEYSLKSNGSDGDCTGFSRGLASDRFLSEYIPADIGVIAPSIGGHS